MVVASKKVRSVPIYLEYLRRAGRAERTIKVYQDSLLFFARFLDVPLDELHHHLTVDNLMAYLDSQRMKELKPNSRRIALAVISRYMRLNGVEFDEMDMMVVRVRPMEAREDKPLEYDTLVKLMDLADVHMKAVISFLISTGCRIGETSKILLSDVRGDVVTIRNEIAKGRRGGKVYLTGEAREYLDLWLRVRDGWVETADKRVLNMGRQRKKGDRRLFSSTAGTLTYHFSNLYHAVDGESSRIYRGKRSMVTPHSCRAYFRTQAATTMGIDLVEGLMRHTGYLTREYVRMSEAERERLFHEGEHALYITRPGMRKSDGEMERLRQEVSDLRSEMDIVKRAQERRNII